jgi:tRNA 2-thiouridine synthesizing protein A
MARFGPGRLDCGHIHNESFRLGLSARHTSPATAQTSEVATWHASRPYPYVTTLARFPADPHYMRMSETLLDVKGMSCPLPVLRANRSLRSMAPGERLRVLATDRAAIADFKAFCQETGHALIAMSEEAGVLSFVIRRRPDPDPSNPDSGQGGTNKVAPTTKET